MSYPIRLRYQDLTVIDYDIVNKFLIAYYIINYKVYKICKIVISHNWKKYNFHLISYYIINYKVNKICKIVISHNWKNYYFHLYNLYTYGTFFFNYNNQEIHFSFTLNQTRFWRNIYSLWYNKIFSIKLL